MLYKNTGRHRQVAAGCISQLSVAAAGSGFVWLEPLTIRLSRSGEVAGLRLDPESISWLVAVIEVGCLLAPPIAGWLANKVGRKPVIFATGPLCILSCLLILLSRSLAVLYLVRLVQGLAVGVVFTVTPIYTAEISEPHLRGRISGLFQVSWYLGVLYAFAVGPFLSYDNYALACLPFPLLFTCAFALCPESPYFLLMSGRHEEAENVLASIRTPESQGQVSKEFADMKKAVSEEMNAEASWKTLFFDPIERKAFLILQIVSITKFWTGMPTIVNYATETFSVGSGYFTPYQLTIILGSLLCGIGILSAFLCDYVGRRCLLLVSCFGVFISHLFTGAYYFLEEISGVDARPFACLMYLGLLGYCFFSDIGLGPLMQTLQAEMFSSKTRGLAAGLTELGAALLSFAVLKAYRPVNDYIGVYMNFWMYSIVGLVGGLFLVCLMFETKGKTIGQMKEKDDESQKGTKL